MLKIQVKGTSKHVRKRKICALEDQLLEVHGKGKRLKRTALFIYGKNNQISMRSRPFFTGEDV